MNVNADVLQKLMEAGYVAAGHGLAPFAERIFAGVEAARPDNEAPAIGRAVAALNAGQPAEAVATLREAAQRFPKSELILSFLGLALQMAGMNNESATILREVAANGDDPQAKAMADALLNPADE